MKMFYKKGKVSLVMMVVLAMLLQIVGPVVGDYVYALEVVEQELEDEVDLPAGDDELLDDGDEEGTEESVDDEGETPPSDDDQEDDETTSPKDEDEELNEEGSKVGEDIEKNVTPDGSDGVPRDLSEQTEFVYEISINDGTNDIVDGGIINIEDLTILGYDVDFDIDNGFKFNNGDYLKLDISELTKLGELVLPDSEKAGRIKFEVDGKDIDAAEYSIGDGTLTIIFDNVDELNGKDGRKGYVRLKFDIKKSDVESELVEEIVLEGTENKIFIIKRKNGDTTAINKEGNYQKDEDLIEWIIDVNTELSDLKNAILTDQIPEGLNIKKIEIIDLKVTTKEISETGGWKEIGLPSDDANLDESKNELELKLGDLKREAKRIKITTSIDSGKTGKLNFENTATLRSDGMDGISDSDTVSFDRITGISKSGEIIGNKIEWTVEFRSDRDDGISDIIDTLTLPPNIKLVLDKDSITINGDKITEGKVEILENNKIRFKDIENSTDVQTLKYSTEVIFEGNGKGTFEISNKAEHNENSADSKVSIGREGILKKDDGHIYGDNDGNTYIDWRITVNKNNENWENVIIKETIPEGFKFIRAKISGGNDLTSTPSGGVQIINVGNITKKTTIVVTTKLEKKEVLTDITSVKNKAEIVWEVNNDYVWGIIGGGINKGPYEDDVDGNFTKDKFQHTVSKGSSNLDYIEKTIDWNVDYKTYNENVKGLIIKDKLVGVQEYNDKSFELKLNGELLIKDTNYTLNFDDLKTEFTLTIYEPGAKGSEDYNNVK